MPLSPERRIVIVGAGPCGLGCAGELDRLGHRNWLILEREPWPGGLAASVVDREGFTWDLGGHVVFSHFGAFDALLEEAMGDELRRHDRSSFIRFGDRWVPYPFQNNLRHLPENVIDECLQGLATARNGYSAADFASWMRAVFGEGITRHFMEPYNAKVWATPAAQMSAGWVGERVAAIDYEQVLASLRDGRDDLTWGPNSTFVFPALGGTGEIYRRIALRLADRIRYCSEVVAIDPDRGLLELAGGQEYQYGALVSTMPLDRLVASLLHCPDPLRSAAAKLRHNSVYMVGVGYETALADEKSWMYFPQENTPFYRATNFAKYAAANVPDGDTARYCSYMTETSYSEHRPEPRSGLEERVEAGLRAAGVVDGRPPLASVHVEEVPYAYPVPTLERDQALGVIQPWLMEHTILSRGRFGSWRYEIGNMDHAVQMGIEAATWLVAGESERLWRA
jgi:protoporphyrinogen oxidase